MKDSLIKESDLKLYSRFLLYFSVTMIAVFMTIFSILLISRRQRVQEYRIQSEAQIQYLGGIIEGHFQSVKSDLLFLPELNEMLRYKNIQNEKDRASIEQEFLNFSKTKKIYDQIRYISSAGQEEIRVNFNTGKPYIVPKEDLQNKKNRYYFSESFALDNGDIYISPLDLNIEYGEIEEPLKPIIRFGTPIFDNNGVKTGVLILNYLADEFLDDLKSATHNYSGEFALANEEGYWLSKSNPDEEWGFMYPERADNSLRIERPELWKEIVSQPFFQIVEEDFMYSSLELRAFQDTAGIKNNPRWYLVHSLCCKTFGISRKSLLQKLLVYNIIAAIIISFLTFLLAKAVDQRNKFKMALTHSALHDSLTNLPNRVLLRSRIEQHIEEFKRYGQIFGVMYIDLDGFKAVNDNFGHRSGDELLCQVANRLKNAVRSSDTVARVGGDEFVILLSHIDNREQCAVVASKVLDALQKGYSLGTGPVNIGGSIGIALTDDGTVPEMDILLKRADKAMYRVKNSGKGNFEID